MKSHPYADMFPMMSDEEYKGLVADIREHGMRESITIFEGKILDGRNRAKACKEVGITPTTVEFKDDTAAALHFVISTNIHRRHLDVGQKAMVAVKYEEHLAKIAKERQKASGGDKKSSKAKSGKSVEQNSAQLILPATKKSKRAPQARDEAAKIVGISHDSVSKAKKISEKAPDLVEKVSSKKMSLHAAEREVDRREKKAELEAKAKEVETAVFAAGPKRDLGWEIITGDCVEVLASLEIQKPRLIFADPPYNIGIKYGDHYNDSQDPDDYIQWADSWLKACARILADDGSLWVLIGDEYAAEYGCLIKDAGLTIRNWIIWYESFGVNCSNKFNRTHRHLFYAVKDPKRFVFNADAVTRPSDRQTKYNDKRADAAGKIWDDVWGVNPLIPRLVDNSPERIPDFPTQLPMALLRPVIECATDPGDLVLDPFNGSGTTGAVAIEKHRRYVGIEASETFATVARARLMSLSGEHTNAAS